MATKVLSSSTLSAFFESVTIMCAAGVQTSEAVFMIGENMEPSLYKRAMDSMYADLVKGSTLTAAMEKTGAFPHHAVESTRIGEQSGRLEETMRSLAVYYGEESRLFHKVRTSTAYPAALLVTLAVILGFTVTAIMPVFLDVYDNFTGGIASGSSLAVAIAIIIGRFALALTIFCAILALVAALASGRAGGRNVILGIMDSMPFTSKAMYQLDLSRALSALATFVASGMEVDAAVQQTAKTVSNKQLKKKLNKVHADMTDTSDPKSMVKAIYDNQLLEPIYGRMLVVGSRGGRTERVLEDLSKVFFDDAITRLDRAIDSIEPVFAVFLTVAVGATLVSVMLPLIGIMGSIG